MKYRFLLPAMLATLSCACVTHIRADVTENPPPREPLSAFQNFRLQPVAAANAEVADQTVAMARVSANVQQKLGHTIQGWSPSDQGGRTLVIEPRIT